MKAARLLVAVFAILAASCDRIDLEEIADTMRRETIDTRAGVAVTGEVIKVGSMAADVHIYVNTEYPMLTSGDDGNICGAQICQDELWQNGVSQIAMPIIGADGIVRFFDEDEPTKATVHFPRLEPGAKYYYRTFVRIGDAYKYGSVRSFTTKELDLPQFGFVDLGLSVQWSASNVRTSSPTEPGQEYTYYSCAAWSLPTAGEWREFLFRCAFTYTAIDGKQGLLATGPSGKSIFLPVVHPIRTPLSDDDDDDDGAISGVPYFDGAGHYWAADGTHAMSFYYSQSYDNAVVSGGFTPDVTMMVRTVRR